jgi:hydrogenase nickel insertion protein HypA
MHELDMIDKIFNLIADEAGKHDMKRVNEAHLEIGRMNGLERAHFDAALAARKDDALAGMKLTIDEIPVTLTCGNCNNSYVDERFGDPHFAHSTSHAPDLYIAPPCPACSKEGAEVARGREMKIVSIDGDR